MLEKDVLQVTRHFLQLRSWIRSSAVISVAALTGSVAWLLRRRWLRQQQKQRVLVSESLLSEISSVSWEEPSIECQSSNPTSGSDKAGVVTAVSSSATQATSAQFGLPNDKFELGSMINAGNQAVVYECTRLSTRHQYAAKVIDCSLFADTHKRTRRLKREICIMRELHHPKIVNILVAFWTENSCTIVMDLARDGNLSSKLKSDWKCAKSKGAVFRGLGGDELVSRHVAKQLLQGIGYMHLNNVVHRDLKLENLLITKSYPVPECGILEVHDIKIADFGLSTVLNSIGGKRYASLNPEMSTVGTPNYMAPEVLDEEYDQRVDYWSFGVILYAMTCGQMPFRISSLRPDRHREAVAKVSECDSWNQISPEGQELIHGLLQVDPDKRLNFEGCVCHPWLASWLPESPHQTPSSGLSPLARRTRSKSISSDSASDEVVGAVVRIVGWTGAGVHCAQLVLKDGAVLSYGLGPEALRTEWEGRRLSEPDVANEMSNEMSLRRLNSNSKKSSESRKLPEPDLSSGMTGVGHVGWGTGGALSSSFELESEELIIGVMQSRWSSAPMGADLGDALVFYTSMSRVLALQGTDARRRNRFVAPPGSQIVGLQFEGTVLTGTHVERVPPSGQGSVAQVSGRTGTDVQNVTFHLHDGSTHFYGSSSAGQEQYVWTLKSTELILIVEQGHKERGLGISLVFYTSNGNVLKLSGVTSSPSIRFAAPSGRQVCGLKFKEGSLDMVMTCSRTGNSETACWHDLTA